MRKIISLGLLALMFSLFSGQLLAGKVQVCEEQKAELKALGLYGLCNAYWNAGNDNARLKILTNFNEKAGPGGPGMPGLESSFSCICWNDFSYDEVCDLANSPAVVVLPGQNAVTFLDFGLLYEVTIFAADTLSCESNVFSMFDGSTLRNVKFNDTSPDFDSDTCMAEVQVISTFRDSTLCE